MAQFSILVVDDDRSVLDMICPFLEAMGLEVAEAKNAASALAMVLETPFDAVLTDLRMPRDSGLDLLQKIKKYRPTIEVFIMTGSASLAESAEIQKLAAAVFMKPFHPEELATALVKAFPALQKKAQKKRAK